MVHCERCGSESVPVDGAFEYCASCGLFVCPACWHETEFCTSCAPALRRRSATLDTALLRRVDRRFREAEHEAASLRLAIATRLPSEAMSSEVACLELKVASAARARDRILRSGMSARRRRKLEPLTTRLDRHAATSYTAAARLASTLAATRTRQFSAMDGRAPVARLKRVWAPIRWAPAALAVLVAAIIAPSLTSEAGRPPASGTLSGVAGVTPAATASADPDRLPSPSSSPSPASAPFALEIRFDDLRMGPITDVAWLRPSAGTRVVAFPTPFDRSLEVRSTTGDTGDACISPGLEAYAARSLSADLRLDERVASVATITMRGGDGPDLEISLGTDGSSVTHAGRAVGSGEGIQPAAWVELRVDLVAHGIDVRATPIEGGTSVAMSGVIDEPPVVQSVCIGVSGEAGASVNYDNLAATFQRSSER